MTLSALGGVRLTWKVSAGQEVVSCEELDQRLK